MAATKPKVKVQIDQKAITRFFTTEPAAQVGLYHVAETVEHTAAELTPRGRSGGQFRTAKGGAIIGPFGTPYGHGFARVSYHTRKFRGGYRVFSRDWYINLIEYGSSKNPVYAPMRRAMRMVGAGKAVIYASKKDTSQATEGEHTGGTF